MAALLLLSPSLSAQTPPVTELDVNVEDPVLTSLVLSAAPHAQLALDGEAFESLSRGLGGSVALAAAFNERYAIRARFAVTRNREQNRFYNDRTTTLDAWVEVRWIWDRWGVELDAGPTFGFARVSRPIYGSPIHGFLAGLGVGAAKPVASALEIIFGAHTTWSSFNRPFGSTPAGFENDAEGHRVSVDLGLGYRWART